MAYISEMALDMFTDGIQYYNKAVLCKSILMLFVQRMDWPLSTAIFVLSLSRLLFFSEEIVLGIGNVDQKSGNERSDSISGFLNLFSNP